MAEIREAIENLKQLLQREERLGYTNAACFGGFSSHFLSCLAELENFSLDKADALVILKYLAALISEYPKLLMPERRETLHKISAALDSLSQLGGEAGALVCTNKKAKTPPLPVGKIGPQAAVHALKQVGPNRAKILARLGIKTLGELIYHFPRRYEDRSKIKKIAELQPGEIETFCGSVLNVEELKPRRRLTIIKATIGDATGQAQAVWFNQPYLKRQLSKGVNVLVTGKVERKFFQSEVAVHDFEVLDGSDLIHAGRIVPVYPATERLPQKTIRQIIYRALEDYLAVFPEQLPVELLEKYKFLSRSEALRAIHFPPDWKTLNEARRRLVYEELFFLQLKLIANKKVVEQKKPGIAHQGPNPRVEEFCRRLPYPLTGAQKKVINEILLDMESSQPMSRLVQGDVGSGKTVVAMVALLKAVDSGFQGALMAPTEILAEQHYLNLRQLLTPLDVRVALLTGSLPKKAKEELLTRIAAGQVDIVVGTHALLQENVRFKTLSLAVTDEQHRFGVMQRSVLQEKGLNPDVLVMTATPIPRTLALTLYGDLDLSVIDELPPGRKPVLTRYIPESKRNDAYLFIKEEIERGRQAYIVCPLVDESEAIEAEAATKLAAYLQEKIFPEYRVGLLHGRMSSQEKEDVMNDFRDNSIKILVATTVIEVGVNVPNATIMLIEGVERFGLAQLHQLRGRIGRGEHKSYCFLMGNLKSDEAKARVKILVSCSDGFVIAEEDLNLRGPGEFFGTRQHGLPELKIADLIKDAPILERARQDAFTMLKKYPTLVNQSQTLRI
ncbi:ATP-dependent DNA helicase RecG [Zhaonella formicivorans]|uniref:ATP-dependent DNA helicase RecG n=1 Tax=Zhaonella formicivorans TaxID=2528593 RepID=UPI0010E64575|nr:ATP-dependent DNA helicase RecG [Zhaonella formicivorans]